MLHDLSGLDVTELPMSDKKVLSLLQSPEALGVTKEQIDCETGTLGLPELGTNFVINMLVKAKPKTFGEMVKISGLSHGTDVWSGNAEKLIEDKVCEFSEVIGCRDDIMLYLSNHGMKPKDAFKIMEFVRKGKAKKDRAGWNEWKEKMKEAGIVDWYIDSCEKIQYMFPKAHACAYVMSAMRIAWFKVYQPLNYYAAYFSIREYDFDIDAMLDGYDAINRRIIDLENKGYEASKKETSVLGCLLICREAAARGIIFDPISLEKSDSKNFVVGDNGHLIPPFRTIDGLGETVSNLIVSERVKRPFLSIEDLQQRAKISQTLIDKLRDMHILDSLPESSQLSLF
jgi:DNA polymerase-3 subunit alpha (Gram-positive type)